jgi:hypothetical protein
MPRPFLILLCLAALTIAAYWQVGECEFVGYDDPSYVQLNAMVNQGLRSASILWALSATHGANWHPLTSYSHMLDCSLFDLNPGPPHWENLLLHVLNTGLVFLVWRRMAAAGNREGNVDPMWPSALVAALFALHPLHVESVAWISERKDVLSTAFWLLTLLAYARWVERPSRGRYALVALGTALALMSKPMAATLPCTLLLLDFWPLRRWPDRSWSALLREKIPLFGLTFALCVATVIVQRSVGATDYGENFTFWHRMANGFVSYARYLGKTFWPETLSPFYPHPGIWPWSAVLSAVAIFVAVSWLAWRERERRPWLAFGWCWYLGTLVPVLGVVMQVGAQSMADRYTYVPLLGIFTIVAWAGAELAASRPQWRIPVSIAAALAVAACFARTVVQVPVWKTGLGLIEHMRRSIGEHEIVYREMGMALILARRPEEDVVKAYQRGLEVAPKYAYFMNELGTRAAQMKRFDEAKVLLSRVVELLPHDPAAFANYGNFLTAQGKLDEAEAEFRRSLAMRPDLGGVYRLLAEVKTRKGQKEEARDAMLAATRCDRWDWIAWNQLGIMEFSLGRHAEAMAAVSRALWINPGELSIQHNLEYLQKNPAK